LYGIFKALNLKIKFEKQKIEQLSSVISENKKFIITFHYNPDGDAIGSALAIYLILQELNKNVYVISPDYYPNFLKWLPGNEEIIVYKAEKKLSKELVAEADVIVCLDFNKLDRLKGMAEKVENSNALKLVIDHHPNPDKFADLLISETEVSSTSELLFHLFKELNFEKYISKDIAECLFTGILTDTGSFHHGIHNPDTFKVSAELMSCGINKDEIFNNIYNNFSEDRMKMMGYCLNEKMNVVREFNTAYISITQKEFKQYNYQTGDTEGFVNLPLSVENIKFSALFTEQYNHIKVSLRSKGNFDVNKFAKKHFNGGGHKNAAGGQVDNSTMSDIVKKFEEILKDYSTELL